MKRNDRVAWCSWVVFLLLAGCLSASANAQSFEITGRTMGPIEYRVVVSGESTEKLPQDTARQMINAELQQVNRLMSTYLADSDVSRFNRSDSTDWFTVDALTAQVVQRSIDISQVTRGAFDITVGPAVALWNFGAQQQATAQLPSEKELQQVRAVVGYGKLSVRQEPPALKKEKAGVQIDLSAIAKGFAVDQVAGALDRSGVTDYLVEVGGEVRTRGDNLQGGPWRIGIEKPTEAGRDVLAVAALENQSLATSGDYRNFQLIDGRRYSHTIDPRTCRPVEYGLASSSVVQDNRANDGCMTADALATALMVLGAGQQEGEDVRQRCLDFCRDQNITGFFVRRDQSVSEGGSAGFSTFSTPGFPLAAPALVEETGQSSGSIWPALLGAVVVFGIAILGMAVGAIFGHKPIQGSCGGLSAGSGQAGDTACSVCEQPADECPDWEETKESSEVPNEPAP
ncbi:MAG: FAD:protein FMN transferase [Mariniblastus sp.]|nr:FAD:protein FMN transferase [Mariniblastus sp.]